MSCDVETLVAGYVLGVLEPADRDLVRSHLPECATCRAALAEVAPLPALLSRVSAEEAAADLPVPGEAMLGRLLTAAGETKRARRRHWYAAAAAVAVLAVGGTITSVALHTGGSDDRLRMTAQQAGIRATLAVRPAASGTAFGLELAGVAPHEHCRLVAIADDGRREVAANWTATYQGTAKFDGSTSLPAEQISRLVVETDDGRELASVDL